MTNEDIEIGSKESLCIQLDGGIAPPELLSCIAAVPHVLGMLGRAWCGSGFAILLFAMLMPQDQESPALPRHPVSLYLIYILL